MHQGWLPRNPTLPILHRSHPALDGLRGVERVVSIEDYEHLRWRRQDFELPPFEDLTPMYRGAVLMRTPEQLVSEITIAIFTGKYSVRLNPSYFHQIPCLTNPK